MHTYKASAFTQRQLDNPDEKITCSLCGKVKALKYAYPTCFGELICGKCEHGFSRKTSYVSTKNTPTEKAHDTLYKAYLAGKACLEITTVLTKGETTIKGPTSQKLVDALFE